MKIVPIMTAKETFSPGDAMRDIYTRGLVTTDFVLVMGDLVSNIRIDEVVRVHKERRKTNKDAIMTMVVKESGGRHRTRWVFDVSFFFTALGILSYRYREDHGVNLRYSCSTQRRPSVCIMNIYKDILDQRASISRGRSSLVTQISKSGMISSTVPLTSALSRFGCSLALVAIPNLCLFSLFRSPLCSRTTLTTSTSAGTLCMGS